LGLCARINGMNQQTLYVTLIAFVCLSYLFGEILEFLNSHVKKREIDARVKDFYNVEKYEKALAYQKAKASFGRLTALFSFVLNLLMLVFGLFGFLDSYLATYISNYYLRALAFFGIIFILSDISGIPFELYYTFKIEEKFGFNKTTPKIFITDKLKSYLLTALLGGGILFLFLILVESLGSLFWIVFAFAAVVISLVINMFYTSLILPLFNKLSPLDDGELKNAVNAYAIKEDLKLEGIYVMDGSKRSNKANAFFSGLGPKKKIVLFDTLIKNHPIDELIAILAHEAGHMKKKHIVKGLIFSTVQIFVTLYIFSLFLGNADLSLALGASSYALHLNLIAFGILFSPIFSVTGLFAVISSRKHEYEADAFGAATTSKGAMSNALKRLSADNLSNLYPHKAYVFFHYSHPPLLSRLEAIEKAASN